MSDLHSLLSSADPNDQGYASEVVSALLDHAATHQASDVHIEPARSEVLLRWRVDGVLQKLGTLPAEVGPNVVARLKVLSGLLTYETAQPQEGSISTEGDDREFRVSTFPSLFGEKVVVRVLSSGRQELRLLEQLGLPQDVSALLQKHLAATSGLIIVSGPAGSGKTTTGYASLREIVNSSEQGRSVATLEDPVEAIVPGAVQSQVKESAGFTMASGLRSLLRQDPEVILIGEIRDRETADIALQAALTGQLVITTFHAGSAAEAVHRLLDMGLPGYAIRNAVRLVISQRLFRKLCDCAKPGDVAAQAVPLGFNVNACRVSVGCEDCRQTGYRGRGLLAEVLEMERPQIQEALSAQVAAADLQRVARDAGQVGLWSQAERAIEAGETSPAEAIRVLGWK